MRDTRLPVWERGGHKLPALVNGKKRLAKGGKMRLSRKREGRAVEIEGFLLGASYQILLHRRTATDSCRHFVVYSLKASAPICSVSSSGGGLLEALYSRMQDWRNASKRISVDPLLDRAIRSLSSLRATGAEVLVSRGDPGQEEDRAFADEKPIRSQASLSLMQLFTPVSSNCTLAFSGTKRSTTLEPSDARRCDLNTYPLPLRPFLPPTPPASRSWILLSVLPADP